MQKLVWKVRGVQQCDSHRALGGGEYAEHGECSAISTPRIRPAYCRNDDYCDGLEPEAPLALPVPLLEPEESPMPDEAPLPPFAFVSGDVGSGAELPVASGLVLVPYDDVPEVEPMSDDEPEVPLVSVVPHAARMNAQARGMVHFIIRFS